MGRWVVSCPYVLSNPRLASYMLGLKQGSHMTDSEQKRPVLRIRIVDKREGEIANVETDVVSLPDHPQFKNDRFAGILDALRAFYEANPMLERINVEVIGDE
jgi:hypothetical protein